MIKTGEADRNCVRAGLVCFMLNQFECLVVTLATSLRVCRNHSLVTKHDHIKQAQRRQTESFLPPQLMQRIVVHTEQFRTIFIAALLFLLPVQLMAFFLPCIHSTD